MTHTEDHPRNPTTPRGAAPDDEDLAEIEAQLDPDELFERAQAQWQAVGQQLRVARMRLGISKREAARRAGLSDGAWRHLEAGIKKAYGSYVLPNPRPENLIAAAKAVDLNPIVLFELTRQHIPEELRYLSGARPESIATPDGQSVTLEGLSDSDIDLILTLVHRLRREEPQP